MINLSKQFNIKRFVLVSSDKAVNPSNVMGASKRICELLNNIYDRKNVKTKYITTRFGNVLGSKGSVVPIFTEQILRGGPITLTSDKITRYFMTMPEASKLLLDACRIGLNDNVYLFDMGKPVKIIDLAKRMITLAGFSHDDIKIKIVGLRKGEKLYEELLTDKENLNSSTNNHIFIAKKGESLKRKN